MSAKSARPDAPPRLLQIGDKGARLPVGYDPGIVLLEGQRRQHGESLDAAPNEFGDAV